MDVFFHLVEDASCIVAMVGYRRAERIRFAAHPPKDTEIIAKKSPVFPFLKIPKIIAKMDGLQSK
ncbi:hypothetical protein [Sinomicrobium weinanense]|uniref:Uncharacterized protein n=1 Tax=Sinomicrobium weinanense TaxID=2842200 RepID=A0A926Q2Z9_9FLAO|nr:hypothetical protein [Sinomicrobium weinanense]MBC9795220.1 hypothetical protein [Sinomicrobium weinanense]MBU3121997.1 hypothetical protein [Sinomicrobium weinanense]